MRLQKQPKIQEKASRKSKTCTKQSSFLINSHMPKSLNILVGGAIEFSNDLYHRLDFEQNQILSDGGNVDPLELEKTAISMIDNRCVYTDLIGKYFGRAAGVVPGQRPSKGSIYIPHAITIAPVKKTRHRKKKQS